MIPQTPVSTLPSVFPPSPAKPCRGIFMGQVPQRIESVWRPRHRKLLEEHLDLHPDIITPEEMGRHGNWLSETEVIFSTWGMPRLTEAQLRLMPRLRAVFYAAGSVKGFADPLLDRGISVVSAWAANAIPVAEFTLSQILYALKLGWLHARRLSASPETGWERLPAPGVYGTTVGLISLGMIGRKVCEYLEPFHLRKLAYDPLLTCDEAERLSVEQTSLPAIFAESDVVSLHAPLLPSTRGMIGGDLLASMRPYATFINTARGALVNEQEMIAVLRARPDLTAVLDVTHPEPPEIDSPLYRLSNVVLTPHIAGSIGKEVERMADLMIAEFLAWREERPLRYAITRELLDRIA